MICFWVISKYKVCESKQTKTTTWNHNESIMTFRPKLWKFQFSRLYFIVSYGLNKYPFYVTKKNRSQRNNHIVLFSSCFGRCLRKLTFVLVILRAILLISCILSATIWKFVLVIIQSSTVSGSDKSSTEVFFSLVILFCACEQNLNVAEMSVIFVKKKKKKKNDQQTWKTYTSVGGKRLTNRIRIICFGCYAMQCNCEFKWF